jgi:hypothetical protein
LPHIPTRVRAACIGSPLEVDAGPLVGYPWCFPYRLYQGALTNPAIARGTRLLAIELVVRSCGATLRTTLPSFALSLVLIMPI